MNAHQFLTHYPTFVDFLSVLRGADAAKRHQAIHVMEILVGENDLESDYLPIILTNAKGVLAIQKQDYLQQKYEQIQAMPH